jgi:uncharacterized phage protein gp47/JayE
MPAYSRPSLSDLDTRINADLAALPAVLRGPLSHAWAQACHGLHGHLEWVDRQCSPLTCELERLYDWAALYGVERLPASLATGSALATGSPGSVVFADTLLRGTNGLDYRVIETHFMADSGAAVIPVLAVLVGEDSNLPPSARLAFISPVPGVDNKLTVADTGITGGAAEETLDDWRWRVADEWQTMTLHGARGGRVEDYRYWCESAHPAVTGALVFPHAMGMGTVVVHPICDDYPDRMPTPGVLSAIAEYLAGIVPATADWKLAAPVIRPVNVTLHLDASIDSESSREKIAQALLFAVLAEKSEESVLHVAELDAAISTVTSQYTRIEPLQNIAAQPGEVLVLAAVTWV